VAADSNYEVSSLGRVARIGRRSTFKAGGKFPARHLLKPSPSGPGYPIVVFSRNGKTSTHAVHQLVAAAFLGPKPSRRHEINHKNLNKLDNRSSNLEWMTRRENMLHFHRKNYR
jgi:hypothetical protein